jgi:hypothetical protein
MNSGEDTPLTFAGGLCCAKPTMTHSRREKSEHNWAKGRS